MDFNRYKLRNIKRRNVANIRRHSGMGLDDYDDGYGLDLGNLFGGEYDDDDDEEGSESAWEVRKPSRRHYDQFMSYIPPEDRTCVLRRSSVDSRSDEEEEEHKGSNEFLMRALVNRKAAHHSEKEGEEDDETKDEDCEWDDGGTAGSPDKRTFSISSPLPPLEEHGGCLSYSTGADTIPGPVLTPESPASPSSPTPPSRPPPSPPSNRGADVFPGRPKRPPPAPGSPGVFPPPHPPPAPPLPSQQHREHKAKKKAKLHPTSPKTVPPTPPPLPPPPHQDRSAPGKPPLVRMQSHGVQIIGLNHMRRDSFHKEVAKKTQTLLIGRPQAEVEVLLDRLIAEHKTKEGALLHVVKEVFPESKVESLVTALLQRGATATECDEDGRTPVFYAVSRSFTQTLRKLLEARGAAHGRDTDGGTPLQMALDKKNDDMAALLIAYMPNQVVRSHFISIAGKPAQLSFHDLLQSNMQQTILGVLDSLMDPTPSGDFRFHFSLLESDKNGRSPADANYDSSGKSAIHNIASTKNLDAVFHDAVRLLLRRKWKCYARSRFVMNAILYLLSLIALTFILVVGVNAKDPLVYDSPLQYVRGIVEVYTCANVLFHFGLEMSQWYRSRMDYWKDPFNWLDLSAIVLLLIVIPLRFTATLQSWPVFGVGYFLWTMRTFKYSAITRSTGAFAQILWSIITKDIVQFVTVFLVVLLAFSGLLMASLKYEGDGLAHWETKSFWATLLTGTRTLVEQQPVLDYAGEDGLGPLSVAVMLMFLFATLVVLLNILIARLSDTYQNVQRDAQRGLELDRAWIVTRVERHSCCIDFRKKYYKEIKTVADLHEKLEKWESPPVSDRTRLLVEVQEKLEHQDLYLRALGQRLHVTQRTTQRLHVKLSDMHQTLRKMVSQEGGDVQDHIRRTSTLDEEERFTSLQSDINTLTGDIRQMKQMIQGMNPSK